MINRVEYEVYQKETLFIKKVASKVKEKTN